jgi:hypothetical protein
MTDKTAAEPGPATLRYLDRMRDCAASLGRDLADVDPAKLNARVVESDAALVDRGLAHGLLRIEGNYLRTADPRQATAWLVEGNPARLCWEYVPHAAAYVELVEGGIPVGAIRFETPESEVGMSLDLVVVSDQGRPLVLGEVKRESAQVRRLADLLLDHVTDPGKPVPVSQGGPSGLRREAWKLAHQLWRTRAPWLLLVAAGERLVFEVRYRVGLELERRDRLPDSWDLEGELASCWPALSLPPSGWGPRGTCPRCQSSKVTHIVIGMPDFGEVESAPSWVDFAGCVVHSSDDRRCDGCGKTWCTDDEG